MGMLKTSYATVPAGLINAFNRFVKRILTEMALEDTLDDVSEKNSERWSQILKLVDVLN